jgi:hypothetical protein
MMLNFLRQLAGYPPAERKERVKRRYRIPDEYVLELLELAEAAKGEGLVQRHKLWARIGEIYPATKEGVWVLRTGDATKLYLGEVRP